MRRHTRFHKIRLVAGDVSLPQRWSLPIIEPSRLPLRFPLPHAPIYPRIPRKIHLLPLSPENNTARLLKDRV
jgi:hypothetical protein